MSDTIGAPYAKGSDTSREAAESVSHRTPTDRARVLEVISRPDGATCDEAETILGLRHQNVSARFWELERMGKIKKIELRRKTRSGRSARVYVVAGPHLECCLPGRLRVKDGDLEGGR